MKKNLIKLKRIPIVVIMLCASCLLSKVSHAQQTDRYNLSGPGSEGSYPYDNLISVGSYLYGMTSAGGTNDSGTVFKIMPDGTNFQILHHFAGGTTDGRLAYGSLVYDGSTYLYGMTALGGIYDKGIVFKITTSGTFTKVYDFAGTSSPSRGSYPYGSLIYDGSTYLYGMTAGGGANDKGTVFKLSTAGAYTPLYDFAGSSTSGSYPQGSLVPDGTFTNLYGMTTYGGANDKGTVFTITPGGTYNWMYNFAGTASPSSGSFPEGSLIYDGAGGYLYGMTHDGGAHTIGSVFKITTASTYTYTPIYDFEGTSTSGSYPCGNLYYDGSYLYGMTTDGGANYLGTIYKVTTGGTYTPLYNFAGTSTSGSNPRGSLISDGTYFYGMTLIGGTGYGTIFKYHDCSLPLTIIESSAPIYNNPTWSSDNYSSITIGTGTSITATINQDFKFSTLTTVNGPFSSGTTGKTLSIVPTPCP